MLVLYFFAYFQRAGVPGTIFDELQRDFALSASAVTGLGAVFVYVYAGMQLAVGVAADRYGGRRMLLFGGALMCAGAVAFPFAGSAGSLYATRILIALGSSFVYLSIVKEVDTLFAPERFAGLMGVVLTVMFLAGLAATLPFERAAHAWGWRNSLAGVGAMSSAGLLVAWAALRRLDRPSLRHAGLPLGLLWEVVRNRRSLPMLVAYLVNFPVVFTMQAVLGKKFLQDVAGLSSKGAAATVLVMTLTCVVAAVCGGPALRLTRQRRKPLLIGAPASILAAILLMLVGVLLRAPPWVFLTAYVLLGLSTLASPAGTAAMKELNRPDAVAIAISVLNGAVYVGVGVLASAAGTVLDLYRSSAREAPGGSIVYPAAAYAVLLAGLAALATASLLVTARLVPETGGRQSSGLPARP
jgi:predicted MFS family arabinose efflux permease